MTSQIVTVSPEYVLKYDTKLGELRDRTYQELTQEFGKKKYIICPCQKKEYLITSQWVKQHFSTNTHTNWKVLQQKEYIKIYGHCASAEEVVEIQGKELRERKKEYYLKNQELEQLQLKYDELEKRFDSIEQENYNLKLELSEYENMDNFQECQPIEEFEMIKNDNISLQKELENRDKELIKLIKERDSLNSELFILKNKKINLKVKKPPFK